MSNSSYWDAATAAPLHPVARQAWAAAIEDGWADPTRLYVQARAARQLLDAAQESIAEQLGARPDEIRLCHSGTDAAYLAVTGGLLGRDRVGTTLVHSAIEHSAVLNAAAVHTATGGDCRSIGVDSAGMLDLGAFATEVSRPGVALAALISASHEVGTVQPREQAAQACQSANVPLYVDAAASIAYGDIPRHWSLLTASARKWGGPTGVGVLAVRTGTRWRSPQSDLQVLRGQFNVPLVVAAAASLRAHRAELATHATRLRQLTTTLRERIARELPDTEIVGHAVARLPHIVTFSCLYIDGEALVHELSRHGFAVSSGSACATQEQRPSHVLAAMGALTHGNVRISLHGGVTEADVDRFMTVLPQTVAALRATAGTGTL